MSRGPGRVQNGCLVAIWKIERRGKLATCDIVGEVYRLDRDADGGYWVTDAQYVAVKRARRLAAQGAGDRLSHEPRRALLLLDVGEASAAVGARQEEHQLDRAHPREDARHRHNGTSGTPPIRGVHVP